MSHTHEPEDRRRRFWGVNNYLHHFASEHRELELFVEMVTFNDEVYKYLKVKDLEQLHAREHAIEEGVFV